MEGILLYSGLLDLEAYIFIVALLGLCMLFLLRVIEIKIGKPLGGHAREKLDIRVAGIHDRALTSLLSVLDSGARLPKAIMIGAVHAGALMVLSLLRRGEQSLKRVLDAVRGRKEMPTNMPPSSAFFAHILPRRRPNISNFPNTTQISRE